MIRRDYILRMLQEFLEVLSRLRSLKREQLWQESADTIKKEFQRLVGTDEGEILQLSETELLAKLIQGEPTQVVRDKTLMLATLLKEAGDVATEAGSTNDSRDFYLKGLHLLLDVLGRSEISDFPEFVPRVEEFVAAVRDESMPVASCALVMQYYERAGEFAKAEDMLFEMLGAEPDNPALNEFGLAFYARLQNQTDASLLAGNLPRAEIEAGREELRAKLSSTMHR